MNDIAGFLVLWPTYFWVRESMLLWKKGYLSENKQIGYKKTKLNLTFFNPFAPALTKFNTATNSPVPNLQDLLFPNTEAKNNSLQELLVRAFVFSEKFEAMLIIEFFLICSLGKWPLNFAEF